MRDRKEEILHLSDQALEDIELSKIPLSQICLKARRLARLSGDEDYERALTYESKGYSSSDFALLSEEAKKATQLSNNLSVSGKLSWYESLEIIENKEKNPAVMVNNNISINKTLENKLNLSSELVERKHFIHEYLLNKNTELKFEDGLDSISDNMIKRVSKKITKHLPDGVQKINSAMENLKSDNHEDWKNAEITARRILESLAKEIEPENSSDKYFDILKKYMKGEYKSVTPVHSKFIIDDVNDGSHSKKTTARDEAEKIFIHICLFLDEIDWDKVDNQIISNKENENKK